MDGPRMGTLIPRSVPKDASPKLILLRPSIAGSSGQKREAVRATQRLPTHRPSRSDWLGRGRCSFSLLGELTQLRHRSGRGKPMRAAKVQAGNGGIFFQRAQHFRLFRPPTCAISLRTSPPWLAHIQLSDCSRKLRSGSCALRLSPGSLPIPTTPSLGPRSSHSRPSFTPQSLSRVQTTAHR